MKKNFLSRREEIILTTIDLMDELGVNNVSIREIANREKVTDAALYKHFKSKEEIFLGVLEYYMRYDAYIFHTVKEMEGTARQRIFNYFRLYAEYYENYPAITCVTGLHELLLYNKELAGKVTGSIDGKNRFLADLITDGVGKGEFINTASVENMVFIFTGAYEKVITMWRLKRYQYSLKGKVEEVIEELLKLYDKKN